MSDILHLVIVWFVGWGLYFLLGKSGSVLFRRAEFIAVYFIAITMYVFTHFHDHFPLVFFEDRALFFLCISAIYVVINYIYASIRQHFIEPVLLIEKYPLDPWLESNRFAILSTCAHILFQQAIITALVILLHQAGHSVESISILFTAVFGALHIPLFFIKGFRMTLVFTGAAIVSGGIFPILLLSFPYGYIANYAVHAGFYVLITFIFWKYQKRILK